MLEHPDVTAIERTGYPAWIDSENRDTPENRAEYIEAYTQELLKWLRDAYPDILDEFLEFAPRYGAEEYQNWLN